MIDLLFVYGTLRRGFARHVLLQRLCAWYVGKGSIAGELFSWGEFPGARKFHDSSRRVVGEVYRLPDPAQELRILDEVEDFRTETPAASLFLREVATVSLENGSRLSAWVYWLNRAPGDFGRITSGDYALP